MAKGKNIGKMIKPIVNEKESIRSQKPIAEKFHNTAKHPGYDGKTDGIENSHALFTSKNAKSMC